MNRNDFETSGDMDIFLYVHVVDAKDVAVMFYKKVDLNLSNMGLKKS